MADGTAIDSTRMMGEIMPTQAPAEKLTKATMKRLKGFDYTKPYFYMVTLKRVKGLRTFCEITKEKEPPSDAKGRVRYLVANELTAAFARVIREFHTKWWGLWPIDCFIVMPDHIHLLIHIKDTGDQLALGKYVYQLMKALAVVYWKTLGGWDRPDSTQMKSGTSSDLGVVLPAPSHLPAAPSPS